ncbi:unnamed protein product [Symbiodinium sp. CCMP2592]|nr:unnamed protein product [Symbiodinium sp. CCMP2592]
MNAMAGISPRRTDLPWERIDAQEQKALEAYCADLDRILESSTDGHMFLERVAALDQRYQEAWFTDEYGSALGDPMQAFRAAPTAGIISAARAPKTASGLGMQGSEILQRHTALLDGPPTHLARPGAGPGPGLPALHPAPRLHDGAGSFARNPISAAGPSARFPAPRAPSPIERRPAPPPPVAPAMSRCSYCGAAIAPEAAYCSRCGMQQLEASPPPPAAEWPWRGASTWGRMPPRI